MIVGSDGYILTNNHVIKSADEIKVVLNDKREYKGKVVGTDPKTNLAVNKIEANNLPSLKLGDSAKLKTGDIVVAIGKPFGLNQTITVGIVSAVGRCHQPRKFGRGTGEFKRRTSRHQYGHIYFQRAADTWALASPSPQIWRNL